MKSNIYDIKGKSVGDIDLPKEIFDVELNNDLVHQVVVSMMSNKRQVLAHTKGRGEVSGGGKKP
jgi:large subunit ribosomal protein L4